MQFKRTKIILSLLIFILSVSSQACLLEQAIALVVNFAPHDHHSDDAHEQEQPAPSHKHDNEGHEATFCCDNSLNMFVRGKVFNNHQTVTYSSSSLLISLDPKAIAGSIQHFYFYDLGPPLSFRIRDMYALSCLLHAPPPA